MNRFTTWLAVGAILIPLAASAEEEFSNDHFLLRLSNGRIVGLKRPRDVFDTDYIMEKSALGDVFLRYRTGSDPWREFETAKIAPRRADRGNGSIVVSYDVGTVETPDMELSAHFTLESDALVWTVRCRNKREEPLEIGDLGLPLPFNTLYAQDPEVTYTQRLIKHSFISGHGSFLYWMRANGVGPYLVMTPRRGTKLEYFDVPAQMVRQPWEIGYTVYIHSAASGADETRGTWRQPHTSVVLSPNGKAGDEVTYGFRFRWAEDYDGVRDVLYDEGLFDVQVAPGMTVPSDLYALISLRTKNSIESVRAEYPEVTEIEYLGEKGKNAHVYKVTFRRLGENLLTVNYGGGGTMPLEFFSTEPLETLVKKRAAFLVKNQQHRDPSRWYNGLFSQWDMRNGILRGPDNTDGFDNWWGYVLACDDPGLCKAPYIAEKNVHYPDQEEIRAVEYYIEHFVWGGLQRTDKEEPYAYGVYGVPNWEENRGRKDEKGNLVYVLGRTYDYPHVIMLYFHMYQIAKYYPDRVRYLDRDGYLDRAFRTAEAFFTIPDKVSNSHPHWCYKIAHYNELLLVDLMDALRAEGREKDAVWLKGEWEKKVKYFIYDAKYPFGSEMIFDSTAFECTHAIAKYAMERPLGADENLWRDKWTGKWYSHPVVERQDAINFMKRQINANVACRGWLEPAYYCLGSDYRMTGNSAYLLSYMSQMGGWAILDFALNFSDDPAPMLRLGYASTLSSWALMNTGTEDTGYGYWYPGRKNDGAAGWAFEPGKFGPLWLPGKMNGRGAWYYDGEIDLGFGGALRGAATIVADDPLFGLFAYGGILTKTDDGIEVIPRDGLRKRFHVIRGGQRLGILLERDGFAKDKPIIVDDKSTELRFTLENRTGDVHNLRMSLSGLSAGQYDILVSAETKSTVNVSGENTCPVDVLVNKAPESSVVIRKK